MDENNLVVNSLYYLAAAVVTVPIFRKLGLGSILGYLAAGIILGPAVTGIIHDPEVVLHFAELGVILLLFLIGLELAPEKLWRMRIQIGITGGSQLLISALIIGVLAFWLSFSILQSLIIGLTLGLSSTAFAMQLMAEQQILASPLGRQGFAILLFQDLAVIPLLLLVESAAPGNLSNHDSVPWWLGPLAIATVLIAGRYLLNPLLKIVANAGSREIMTAAGLLIVLGIASLMQKVGFSMGLGAFVAGIVLANSSFRHQLEADIEPFKGILLGLFFIAVGMTLNLKLLLLQPGLILGAALLLMLIKTLVITLIVRLQKACLNDSVQLGLMLSQGGEFAFVVMALATKLAMFESAFSDQLVLVVGLSMALTSPLVALQRKFWPGGKEKSRPFDSERDAEEPEVIIAGFGRFGQIVGRILAAEGIPFTALDKDASHVDFVKRFGNKTFFGDATRMDLLRSAGVGHARLLVLAIDDQQEALEIIKLSKAECPKLKIIARAHNRMDAYQMHALDVDVVIRETLHSSLQAAKYTLTQLGLSEGQALERVEMFSLHDEKMLLESVAYRDDFDSLINLTKQGRKELEELFEKDTHPA